MSIARDIVLFASTTVMSEEKRKELLRYAAQVRRVELALDELVDEAREQARLAEVAANVVHVDFFGGRR